MRVRTHLLSMPWASPDAPSIQLGCLTAYLRRAVPDAGCRAYSAHFSILHALGGHAYRRAFARLAMYGEYLYQALYLRRFGPAEVRGRRPFLRLLRRLRDRDARPPGPRPVEALERVTRRYLDAEVGPALLARGLNLVGFTLNFDQTYASLYAAAHLRHAFPGRRFLFVFGGSTAIAPSAYRLLCALGVQGLVVAGEGERKLELLVRTLRALPEGADPLAAVAGLHPGIIRIGDPVDLTSPDPARHGLQVERLGDLPLPDYDEFFASLRRACADRRTFAAFQAETTLFVEGTRGCFGHCDFCAMNRSWHGFRRWSAEEVLEVVLALTQRHRTVRVQFVDNVCDTWARRYAELVLAAGLRQQTFMELRAHHGEEFWALLSLAGVEYLQVGVEALSGPLLRAIGKGTTPLQNLAAHKVLCELGVHLGNNLITHHPASTLADVRETRRILREIPHWAPFDLTRFRLMAGSPLYQRLSAEERAGLLPVGYYRLPRATARFACEYSDELPPSLRPARALDRAWDAFRRDYEAARERHARRKPRLEVARVAPGVLRITDTRDGAVRLHDLAGDAARVLDACHRGLGREALASETGLPAPAVDTALARLRRARLVLEVDGAWLALALRPRDELLARLAPRLVAGAAAAGRAPPEGRLAVLP